MKVVQTISIGTFTINSIGGASIVQIGTSGMIQSRSESYETTQTAKEAPVTPVPAEEAQALPLPADAVHVEIPDVGEVVDQISPVAPFPAQ